MKKVRRLGRVIFGRTSVIALLFILQIIIFIGCLTWLNQYITYIYGAFILLSSSVVIYILNSKENPSFKLVWIIPILVIPVFGVFFYLFTRVQLGTKTIEKRLLLLLESQRDYLHQDKFTMEALEKENVQVFNLAKYMNKCGGFPIHTNTSVKYFPCGEDKFEEMKIQLESAKEFIFMEYFIIENGVMWDTILEILERKVRQGVEVRVMYDGMCSLALLPYNYPKKIREKGIQCKMYAPIVPFLSTYQNNRDHRKIIVIDGHTAFTGGINLADEYINEYERFGHWKDTAVMLKGEAVKSFTLMFLSMWDIDVKEKEDYEQYIKKDFNFENNMKPEGYIMPYGDSPFDNENVGEQVYMDILNTANKYVHIMTPYLILDNEMITALTYSAKRGVETIIIMPHIPDKKYAYLLARTYYEELIEAGVKIYEYTPGFVHAKVFVSDDEKAVVGTINMDFRSFYLHFECASYIYKNLVIRDIEEDFQNTLKKCKLITIEDCKKLGLIKKLIGRTLKLFAPLM